ncbi:hypothetical protein KY290_017009 [Solanum tuberosum]|uniref:Uncharacterized protein n=1 Tax=Solanum tuberosum TaxID=4113 RepID=A0ABQ7VA85_SOLTU|nr:hypothetical protein KY284_016079 [Solanum tuberosum]KAH0760936.1 hypothetical protein KY290_017009 [Solanum tuberosum]
MGTEGSTDELASLPQPKVADASPYSLHPSDHPGLIFVTNPLSENGENYFTWSMSTPSCTCGCICGAAKKMQSMREEEKVFDFLMGLDDTFSTQILSVDPLPNLGRAYALTTQEEKQRFVAANRIFTIEATALLTRGGESRQRKVEDWVRHQFPPFIHYGRTNHSKDYCYRVIGYPPDWRKPGKKNNKPTNNDQMQFRGHQKNQNEPNALAGKTKDEWIVDTGATNSITHDINSLSNKIVHTTLPPVQIPNGDTVKVHALGQVAIGKRLILENVLGVPDFLL